MPALLEDPESAVIYRQSGQGPYPTPDNPQIPSSIFPRPVTLRDRVTIATLVPFFSPEAVPKSLLAYLSENLNKEIELGDTYPMINPLPLETFGPYWFGNFGAVMILGDIGGIEGVQELDRNGADWNKICLGSFYVKPNYPGRSSHVCNGGFLVTPAARNKGVGKSMGQCYLDWAPQLGYTYSVFNLVYESNTASTRIWDSLGFKRIGRVPGCGQLQSSIEPVDAIIYGKDLKADGENDQSEERFDKIRYYLRHLLYPQGADRSEKSRLRSAATHYKLVGGEDGVPEKLFLKDKEVISDPQAQYEIAKQIHLQAHGGINKTTAIIATKYHWIRIKETVSHVIKNCPDCKDVNKPPTLRTDTRGRSKTIDEAPTTLPESPLVPPPPSAQPPIEVQTASQEDLTTNHISNHDFASMQQPMDLANDHLNDPNGHLDAHLNTDLHLHRDTHLNPDAHLHPDAHLNPYDDMAIDPQIMEQIQAMASEYDQDPNVFVQAGLTQFDAPHLQPHNPHDFNHQAPDPHDFNHQPPDPHDFNHQPSDHQFMNDTNGGLMAHDHVMDETGAGTGLSNMQPIQHVLPMDYLDASNNQQYKLEQ
ncbi:Protein spt10 [Exophiala xenobiotica]|nr:Protein spt10 [Exophiala xenobiotica]KAK5205878.1 Protein spt10 [Exophiala xenobiotica]KAK5217088.1 Protein spt10 [Exophiala xenobiotica]KAK5225371.1 Protein spt10 [Exophiala xenobiotica]KAK5249522.1 Protein spt10 [Exophiala xenobiotica]